MLHKESNKLISNPAYTFSKLITMINHGENNYVTMTLTSMMKLLRSVIKIHCVCVCVCVHTCAYLEMLEASRSQESTGSLFLRTLQGHVCIGKTRLWKSTEETPSI